MRVQIKDLSQHLKKGMAALYFVWGEEPLQRMEALDAIRAQAIDQGYNEREIIDLSSMDERHLTFTLNTASLFAEKRLIECRLKEDKITKAIENLVLHMVSSLHSDNILLLVYPQKLEYAAFKASWFLALEKAGITVAAQPLYGDQWQYFVQQRAAHLNLKFDSQALTLIQTYTEGNLLACAQLLERLSLGLATTALTLVTPETLIPFLSFNARYSVFELVDTLLLGDISRTTRILGSLKGLGEEVSLILWVITKEVRNLILLCEKCNSTGQIVNDNIMDVFNIWKTKRAATFAFLKRHPLSSLYHALTQIQTIDILMKTSGRKECWPALHALCMYLVSNDPSANLQGESHAKIY